MASTEYGLVRLSDTALQGSMIEDDKTQRFSLWLRVHQGRGWFDEIALWRAYRMADRTQAWSDALDSRKIVTSVPQTPVEQSHGRPQLVQPSCVSDMAPTRLIAAGRAAAQTSAAAPGGAASSMPWSRSA